MSDSISNLLETVHLVYNLFSPLDIGSPIPHHLLISLAAIVVDFPIGTGRLAFELCASFPSYNPPIPYRAFKGFPAPE